MTIVFASSNLLIIDNSLLLASGSQDSYIRLWKVCPSIESTDEAMSLAVTKQVFISCLKGKISFKKPLFEIIYSLFRIHYDALIYINFIASFILTLFLSL